MHIRRTLATLLAALVCLLSCAPGAAADTAVRMEGGLFAKGDIVWLGQIDLTDVSGAYDGPIPWLVLDPTHAYDGTAGSTTILSRYGLALSEYNTASDGWQDSVIRRSIQAMAADRSVFSQREYDLMLPITTSGEFALRDDRLYPLTMDNVSEHGYLPSQSERIAYAITSRTTAITYWLRFYQAPWNGVVNFMGERQMLYTIGAKYPMRPAASIQTSDIALYASPGGKLDGDAGLATNGPLPSGEYVLTLFDTSRGFSAYYGTPPEAIAVARAAGGGATVTDAGGTVDVTYNGATQGPYEYISAMVTGGASGTDVLFYGRVRYVGEDGDESGTVAINVPAGLTPGGVYTLRVFSEQHNSPGDGPSRLTDYISDYSEIHLTVKGSGDVPATGDQQNPFLWFGLAAFCAAGLAGLRMARRVRCARR